MVGFTVVLQQTPFTVTVSPPSDVTLPPPVPVVAEVADGVLVITVGGNSSAGVEKVMSAPYPVPAELVAYALTW